MEPAEFVSGVFPDGKFDLIKPTMPSERTGVAILCSANFDPKATLADCNHWLPGWVIDELGSEPSETLSRKWLTELEDEHNAQQLALTDQLEYAFDDALVASLEHEIQAKQQHASRFKDFMAEMENRGIICRDVVADGNCGVATALWLQRGLYSAGDLKPEFASVRETLKAGWQNFASSIEWRILWDQLCMARPLQPAGEAKVDAPHAEAERSEQASEPVQPSSPQVASAPTQDVTPKKPKANLECPFTPDPVEKKRGLVAVDSKSADGIVEIPAQGATPKKQRTGKAGKIEATVNFQQYFELWLGDRGISYREFMAMHSNHAIVVRLGRMLL